MYIHFIEVMLINNVFDVPIMSIFTFKHRFGTSEIDRLSENSGHVQIKHINFNNLSTANFRQLFI